MSFEVKIPFFEGPFDLLLFFIERDELDIYDIPIAKITNDFLDYIHHLEKLNIEVASEFILVAATLMRIKAKTLLPRPVLDEEGQEIDPRDELVKHLLEYRKYKSVIEDLSSMEEKQLSREKRGSLLSEIKSLTQVSEVESELQSVDLYKLLKVFEKVMQRFEIEKNKPKHTIIQYPYTIAGQKIYILNYLKEYERLSFEELMLIAKVKVAVIFNFLAILELLQLQQIKLHLGEGYNNFWVAKKDHQLV